MTTIELTDEIRQDDPALMWCFECAAKTYAGKIDSCQEYGHRYDPSLTGEICNECGSEHWDSHCEKCDSTDIEYYNNYLINLANGEYA